MPKYDIDVQLTGEEGNAFVIISNVRKEMTKAGLTKEQVKEFLDEAMSGDYDHLLRTCVKYVNIF